MAEKSAFVRTTVGEKLADYALAPLGPYRERTGYVAGILGAVSPFVVTLLDKGWWLSQVLGPIGAPFSWPAMLSLSLVCGAANMALSGMLLKRRKSLVTTMPSMGPGENGATYKPVKVYTSPVHYAENQINNAMFGPERRRKPLFKMLLHGIAGGLLAGAAGVAAPGAALLGIGWGLFNAGVSRFLDTRINRKMTASWPVPP